jgi:hypothetical protein
MSIVRRHPARLARILAVIGAIAGLAACSSDGGSGATATDGDTTVAGTSDPIAGDVLLTEDELRTVPGFETGTVQAFNSVPSFSNPDPRGPCGGTATNPPLDGAAGTAYTQGNSVAAFHLVVPTTPVQTSYLTALAQDRKDPCPTWESTTNTGATQTVSNTTFVDVGDLAGEALSWTSTISSGEATAYAGVLIVVDDQVTSLLQVQSLTPISDDTMRSFAQHISGAAS